MKENCIASTLSSFIILIIYICYYDWCLGFIISTLNGEKRKLNLEFFNSILLLFVIKYKWTNAKNISQKGCSINTYRRRFSAPITYISNTLTSSLHAINVLLILLGKCWFLRKLHKVHVIWNIILEHEKKMEFQRFPIKFHFCVELKIIDFR